MNRPLQPVIPVGTEANVKRWRLPFWTEKPAWESERLAENVRTRSRVVVIKPEPAVEELPVEPEPIVEEIEDVLEPVQLPTAEEIETIRREAHNDGLEQGLIEGRQQGYQEGHEQGYSKGYAEASELGHKEGYEAGYSEGNERAEQKNKADFLTLSKRFDNISKKLTSRITERDSELPEVLTKLVTSICTQVVAHELSQGAQSIYQFVQAALNQLPEGEENIQIFVGPDDAKHLQMSIDEQGQDLTFEVDAQLPAGVCRVESENSLAEFSAPEHLQQVLAKLHDKMLHSLEQHFQQAQAASLEAAVEATEAEAVETLPNDESSSENSAPTLD